MSSTLRQIRDSYNFELTRKIASGGMGAVYEGIQLGAQGFRKRMAIKLIHEQMSRNTEFVDMFIGEAKLVANLVHQNIVQIYQLGQTADSFYIAMEYVNGLNLDELQQRYCELDAKVDHDLAAFIISRVCRALQYAHHKRDDMGKLLGVVHRDVSPRNIMITLEGVVKLTDFGIAKAADLMLDREGDVLLGKTCYMSPEQAAFQSTDGRSDIFSLGICAYELLSDSVLFEKAETMLVLENVCTQNIPPISHICQEIPQELARIIDKALERDLNRRYGNAGDMGNDLEHFMYDKGYGPTNLTMEKHLREIFPEKFDA